MDKIAVMGAGRGNCFSYIIIKEGSQCYSLVFLESEKEQLSQTGKP